MNEEIKEGVIFRRVPAEEKKQVVGTPVERFVLENILTKREQIALACLPALISRNNRCMENNVEIAFEYAGEFLEQSKEGGAKSGTIKKILGE